MKKYIFTESQIKKIIDNQLNEELTISKSNGVTGTVRKSPHAWGNDVKNTPRPLLNLKNNTVKLVVLGFRSDVSTSDVYNKNYKAPSVIGSIAGTPIDKNSKGKQFDNDTPITLINGSTLVFGVVGSKSQAEANGGLTLKNEGGKLILDYAWD